MNFKSISDIIDYDFLRVCCQELSFDFFNGELSGFLLCDEINVNTYLFLQKAVPIELFC